MKSKVSESSIPSSCSPNSLFEGQTEEMILIEVRTLINSSWDHVCLIGTGNSG